MDMFERITASLEPIGGPTHLDAFVRARLDAAARATAARKAAAAAARAEAQRAAQTAAPVDAPRPRAGEAPSPAVPTEDDTGKLKAEVAEFMKERAGFDPTEAG